MHYLFSNLGRDKQMWATIGLVAVAALNVMDFLSVAFAAPGFFNLWVIRITAVAGFGWLIGYYFFQRRRDKKRLQIEALLPAFLEERRATFEKMTAVDTKFQTFCFDCRHYDSERRSCNLRLHDRQTRIKLRQLDVFSFCLYWNLDDHPILSLTERRNTRDKDKSDGKGR